jgi:hypothetical protein
VNEYRVTFGQKYHREEHPTCPEAHPDGWVTILAPNYVLARRSAADVLERWFCDLVDVAEQPDYPWDLYPRGELCRWEAVS